MTNHYDVVIIGSGMGGLVCGDLLSRVGKKVCILEKNKQIGGCLQVYSRDKVVFDSGVHYLGGLDKGQNLHQLFKYLGILDKLKLQQLDKDAFDKILIYRQETEFCFAQGYENFISKLLVHFPTEEVAIRAYCDKIKEVCNHFPLYNLRKSEYGEKEGVLEINTKTFIESITADEKLRVVLAGNNFLYAGQADKTPFYVHALILNSYIESAWRTVDGGSQIGKHLSKNLHDRGGVIKKHSEVTRLAVEEGKLRYAALKDGTRIEADLFISNMHPVKTLEMTETELIKPFFRKRLNSLENSIGSFTVNIVLKKNTFKYSKSNYYCHKEGHVWSVADYDATTWPLGYAIFFSASSKSEEYAEGMSILTYMKFEDVKQWANTFNIVSQEEDRGADYEEFKRAKAEKLIDMVAHQFPNLRDCIKAYYCSTPLSYRDYIGNDDGSMYGVVKDYKDSLKTFISPRTKIPNLFFTGQNLNMHGILGSAMSGVITYLAITGDDDIIEQIKNA